MLAVDAHAHVLKRDLPLVAGRHSAPKRDASVEEYVALLDANDVSHGLLTAPSFYGPDNSLLTASLRKFPKRLRGTAIVDPAITDEALVSFEELNAIMGLSHIEDLERRFLTEAQRKAKYGDSGEGVIVPDSRTASAAGR